jgi:xylulokinase
MRLSGEIGITVEGLSEGIFWDFKNNCISEDVINYYGIPKSFFPEIIPTFGIQSTVSASAAQELGLKEGTPISYRAGDQPNNALSECFQPRRNRLNSRYIRSGIWSAG